MSFGGGTFGGSLFGSGEEADPISNLGFETGSSGIATSWDFESFAARENFGAELADGSTFESFEHSWENDGYQTDLVDGISASVETFELGWSNTDYIREGGPLIAPSFGTADVVGEGPTIESFEIGWGGNELFIFAFRGDAYGYELTDDGMGITTFGGDFGETFGDGDTLAPVLSGVRALSVESFEDLALPLAYTADSSTDTLTTATPHGLSVNYRVRLQSSVGGAMPAPLVPDVDYYVQAVGSSTTFKVAQTLGGAAVDVTSNGSGLLIFTAPYENWTSVMTTI